jgi:hypothetical protein
VQSGVTGRPDINAIAARKNREIEILVWNYHDEDLPDAATSIMLTISGLPTNRALLEHFRVDAKYSNAFASWQHMGSPQSGSYLRGLSCAVSGDGRFVSLVFASLLAMSRVSSLLITGSGNREVMPRLARVGSRWIGFRLASNAK